MLLLRLPHYFLQVHLLLICEGLARLEHGLFDEFNVGFCLWGRYVGGLRLGLRLPVLITFSIVVLNLGGCITSNSGLRLLTRLLHTLYGLIFHLTRLSCNHSML